MGEAGTQCSFPLAAGLLVGGVWGGVVQGPSELHCWFID